MGSVFNRGTRDRPNYYAKFRDVDGEWTMKPTHQPTKAQARTFLANVEARVARGLVGIPERVDEDAMRAHLESWRDSLTNRSADRDKNRVNVHLLPMFGTMRPSEVTTGALLDWIEAQRAGTAPRRKPLRAARPPLDPTKKRPGPKPKAKRPRVRVERVRIAEGSIRHNLNLLSRFFGWMKEHGHATTNPVRELPMGKRPHVTTRRDVPWLDDDAKVRELYRALGEPFAAMFYLCNRAGLRTGEATALRLSDVAELESGSIRVRFSNGGQLKEDRLNEGKVKFVPAPDDAAAVLAPIIAKRRAQGAGPEDLLFTFNGAMVYRLAVVRAWDRAAGACGVSLTWYQATRHSFVSRSLAAGASLDEVSAAVGHSSPTVTKRYYDHFIRKQFSPTLTRGLGLGAEQAGKVLPMKKSKRG